MATGMAIFSGVTTLMSMGQQQSAARKARAAGEEGARSILEETAQNIKQAKKSQAQTLGIAMARTAASGVRFDAAKIGEVDFSEGPDITAQETAGETGGGLFGRMVKGTAQEVALKERLKTEPKAGAQTAGAREGDSAFMYLREMKKTFSEDIGWMTKQGRSRAKVARMGGQVAYAQAQAGITQTAMTGFGQAYDWWKQPSTPAPGGTT